MELERKNSKYISPKVIGIFLLLFLIAIFINKSSLIPGGSDALSLPLSQGGISYSVPSDWQVYDPPTEQDINYLRRQKKWPGSGFILIHIEKFPLAIMLAPNGMTLVIAAQEPRPVRLGGSEPSSLQHLIDGEIFGWFTTWYDETKSLLVKEKYQDKMVLADGSEIDYYEARSLPGILAGSDLKHAIGFGLVKDKYIMVAAGSRTEDWSRELVLQTAKSIRTKSE